MSDIRSRIADLPPEERRTTLSAGAVRNRIELSSLAEVADDATITVYPQDHAPISDAVRQLQENSGEREQRVARGIAWVKTFTWARGARQTVAVYCRALGRPVQ